MRFVDRAHNIFPSEKTFHLERERERASDDEILSNSVVFIVLRRLLPVAYECAGWRLTNSMVHRHSLDEVRFVI